jgi:hypothetical protein
MVVFSRSNVAGAMVAAIGPQHRPKANAALRNSLSIFGKRRGLPNGPGRGGQWAGPETLPLYRGDANEYTSRV